MAWWETHITQDFKWTWSNTHAHSGIDLAESDGTPLTAAVAGRILHAGAHNWGGQVDILFEVHGQDFVLSYLHMREIAAGIHDGVDVRAGQYLGKSGGATWSSPFPTASNYSSGPHLHFELWIGEKAPYTDQSPWRPDDAHHPIDPTNMFYVLKANGIPDDQSAFGSTIFAGDVPISTSGQGPSSPPPAAGQRAHAILQEAPGFYGIVKALDTAETFNPWTPPQTIVPVNVGDVQVSLGPATANVHVPGVSDLAAAAAQSQTAARTAAYGASWLIGNMIPLLVRLFLILLGLGLIAALIYAQIRKSELFQDIQSLPDTAIKEVGGAAVMAA